MTDKEHHESTDWRDIIPKDDKRRCDKCADYDKIGLDACSGCCGR